MRSSAEPKAMAAAAASSTPSALVEVPSTIEKVYDMAAGQPRLPQAVWQPQTTPNRNAPTTRTKPGPTQVQAEETTLVQKKNY